MLIVHEVMGRNCGWLTAATAQALPRAARPPGVRARDRPGPRAARRPRRLPARIGDRYRGRGRPPEGRHGPAGQCEPLRLRGRRRRRASSPRCRPRARRCPRDAFGHVKLDAINPGKWFGDQFAKMIGAEKVAGPEERLFCPGRRRQRRGPAADQELRRSRRRVRPAAGERRHRPRRGSRRRPARDRVRPHQGRQAVRSGRPAGLPKLLTEIGQPPLGGSPPPRRFAPSRVRKPRQ